MMNAQMISQALCDDTISCVGMQCQWHYCTPMQCSVIPWVPAIHWLVVWLIFRQLNALYKCMLLTYIMH